MKTSRKRPVRAVNTAKKIKVQRTSSSDISKYSRLKRLKSPLLKLLLAVIAGSLILFFYLDFKVAKRLETGQASQGSHILSDYKNFKAGSAIDLEILRKALSDRGYRSVKSSEPSEQSSRLVEGEYIDAGNRIILHPRSFEDNSGKTISTNPVSIESGSTAGLTLEPRILASLTSDESRISRFIPLNKIPQHLINAVVSIEDERFYSHFGVDPIGILRALVVNLSQGKIAQGGSTITQQLAKNLFFSLKKSLIRKILEIPTALSLEFRLSKDQIMEMYLNEVYLGQDGSVAIHGVAEASKAFFAKQVSEISAAEAALLAGLIQAPSLYSPQRHLARAIERRNQVLEKMLNLNYINQKDFLIAKSEKPKIVGFPEYRRNLPYFTNVLRESLAEKLDINSTAQASILIRTGIDADYQECAEKIVQSAAHKIEREYPGLKRPNRPLEMALVAIEPFSGKVRAWVGGRDFSKSQFDRVSKAKRQIGSTIKPFVYLTALDGSLNNYKVATATSILYDQATSIKLSDGRIWQPENYDHQFRGEVTLRYALENSLNIPAVNISQKYGVKALAKTLEVLKLRQEVKDLPSLALGALDTSLLNLTAAYAALANGGRYIKPRLYISAQDAEGSNIIEPEYAEQQIAAEGPTFVLTSILQGVVERGTGKSIRAVGYKGPAAGKTGTTNEARDAWFIGYTPELAVGIWVGFDDNKKIGLTGGQVAAPAWGEFMKCAEKQTHFEDFIPPPSVSLLDIDPVSGLRFNSNCPSLAPIKEYFVSGTEPESFCKASDQLNSDPNIGNADEKPEDLPPKRRETFWEDLFG